MLSLYPGKQDGIKVSEKYLMKSLNEMNIYQDFEHRRWTPARIFIYMYCSATLYSASFLAEISVGSPQKLYIFIIYKNIFWIKVSKKYFYLILKKEALLGYTNTLVDDSL